MDPVPMLINLVLEESRTSNEALRGLSHEWKRTNPKYSITYFCRKLGLSSKGNFGNMMNGTRKIPKKHWERLAEVFKLTDEQRQRFNQLLHEDENQIVE